MAQSELHQGKTTVKIHLNGKKMQRKKQFECEYCEYKARKGHLNVHIKAVHERIKPFECELCEYKASHNGNLTRHIKAVHGRVK